MRAFSLFDLAQRIRDARIQYGERQSALSLAVASCRSQIPSPRGSRASAYPGRYALRMILATSDVDANFGAQAVACRF